MRTRDLNLQEFEKLLPHVVGKMAASPAEVIWVSLTIMKRMIGIMTLTVILQIMTPHLVVVVVWIVDADPLHVGGVVDILGTGVTTHVAVPGDRPAVMAVRAARDGVLLPLHQMKMDMMIMGMTIMTNTRRTMIVMVIMRMTTRPFPRRKRDAGARNVAVGTVIWTVDVLVLNLQLVKGKQRVVPRVSQPLPVLQVVPNVLSLIGNPQRQGLHLRTKRALPRRARKMRSTY